jgi:hypothetical protein
MQERSPALTRAVSQPAYLEQQLTAAMCAALGVPKPAQCSADGEERPRQATGGDAGGHH